MEKKNEIEVPEVQEIKHYRHYTSDEVIAALKKARGMIHIAAEVIGCDPTTIRNHMKRNHEVQKAYNDITQRELDLSELQLFRARDNGEPWAVCFHLKTKGKKRGYIERDSGNEGMEQQRSILDLMADATRERNERNREVDSISGGDSEKSKRLLQDSDGGGSMEQAEGDS